MLTTSLLKGACGRVTGHWDVDINEPGCTPWWVNFRDKAGCVLLESAV